MADRIDFITPALVLAVATQPGKSGQNAENPLLVGSITIRYLFISVLPA